MEKLKRPWLTCIRCMSDGSKKPQNVKTVFKRQNGMRPLNKDMSAGHLESTVPVISFNSLKQKVYRELVGEKELQGTGWKRFAGLNRILKGHRRGELTVMTGGTGSGKTTFLSEYSLDLCSQGVKTLWGSFEMKNVRMCKLMLNQLARIRLEENIELFEPVADAFATLPMHFMDFHGEQSLKTVMETMEDAVANYDVHHILIDNIQFMLGSQYLQTSGSRYMNRFEYQDLIIGTFRRFATDNDCHVTVVIHPRKEPSTQTELTNNSIFGGAKAIQEADNIFILQMKYADGNSPSGNFTFKKYLQITKNRFDGDLGIIPLLFDKDSQCFSSNMLQTPSEKRNVTSVTPPFLHPFDFYPK